MLMLKGYEVRYKWHRYVNYRRHSADSAIYVGQYQMVGNSILILMSELSALITWFLGGGMTDSGDLFKV